MATFADATVVVAATVGLVVAIIVFGVTSVALVEQLAFKRSVIIDVIGDGFSSLHRVLVSGVMVPPLRGSMVFMATSTAVFLGGWATAMLLVEAKPALAVIRHALPSSPNEYAPRLLMFVLIPTATGLAISGVGVRFSDARGLEPIAKVNARVISAHCAVFAAGAVATLMSPRPLLMLALTFPYAACVSLRVFVAKLRAKYLARVFNDRGTLDPTLWRVRFLWNRAQQGHVFSSWYLSRLLVRSPAQVEEFELLAILAYHRHRYSACAHLAVRGRLIAMGQGQESAILDSYECLARARMGDLDASVRRMQTIVDRLQQGRRRRPYFRCNLAYLLWSNDEVAGAIQQATAAVDEHLRLEGKLCLQAAMFLSLFLSERLLDACADGKAVQSQDALYALGLAAEAERMLREGRRISWGQGFGSASHNVGLACLLLAENNPEIGDDLRSFAFDLFARAIFRESHAAARMRMIILHMIGTRNYTSAEYQCQRLRWPLGGPRLETRFGRQLRMLQERIREAKRCGVVFGPRLLTVSSSTEVIPEAAVVGRAQVEEVRAKRDRWLTFEVRNVVLNPLENPPERVHGILKNSQGAALERVWQLVREHNKSPTG